MHLSGHEYFNALTKLFIFVGVDVEYFENFDLNDVCTPINVNNLDQLLRETGYNREKSEFLVDGFKSGFDLGYRGPENVKLRSPNLKFTIGSKEILWNKVMKEVKLGRYVGPFKEIPFENYIQSPIGLVPKDGNKTRLIFHLSYPKGGNTSVNSNTPKELTSVKYNDFDHAVRLCREIAEGEDPAAGKSDLTSAFRQLPIKKKFWKFLIMKAQSPLDGDWYFFVDKCLPFGAAISCAVFQEFSNALSHIVRVKSKGTENVNYLDDFLFLAAVAFLCNHQLSVFLRICEKINFPVSEDKTEWASKCITFLGLLIDLRAKLVRIPQQKIVRATNLINKMLTAKKFKTTLRELQELCGYLNFLCKAIIPGRTFTRRLYMLGAGLRLPHHHLKLKADARADLKLWLEFLQNDGAYNRPFFHFDKVYYVPTDFATDASKSATGGCRGVCGTDWYIMEWDQVFLNRYNPSINYLELFALTVGILSWADRFENQNVTFFCDNQSVMYMVNNGTSKCSKCLVLLRLITLFCMRRNICIHIEYIDTQSNFYADALSRLQYKRFWTLARKHGRKFKSKPTKIPDCLQDMEALWKTD